jgi:hypothetical protein
MELNPETQAEQDTRSKKNKGFSKKPVVFIVLCSVVIGAAGGYFGGYQMGRKAAAREVSKRITDIINPLNVLSSNPLFPHTVVGKVTNVGQKELTVKQLNGDSRKIIIDSKTQITQQAKSLVVTDIKKDASVTVLLKQDSNKDQDLASRIIIR